MIIKVKKLNSSAVLPKKAHIADAGFDLTAISKTFENGCYIYGTGIAIEIPKNHVGLIFSRSSIHKKDLRLTNAVAVIDSGYNGEIILKFVATRNGIVNTYEIGDRIGQLIIIPYPEVEFEEVSELSQSERGNNGFGSSGK